MPRRLLLLALVLALVPRVSSAAEPLPFAGTGDEERSELEADGEPAGVGPAGGDERPAPSTGDAREAPAESRYEPMGQRQAAARNESGPARSRTVEEPRYRADPDYVPATRSLTVDLGGGMVSLGGYAFPKIAFSGAPDNAFHAFGLGGAFRLFYDFPAMDFDWRVGLNGALPGYLGMRGTVGIAKDISPVVNPRFVARGGVGVEVMMASANKATYLVPNFLGEGDLGAEFEVMPNRLFLGASFALALRYGLPLGFGLDVGGFFRARLML
ncbi:MAG: hypothetical protein ACOX6T_11425 [Myxococcales bacterium]|jgi:hypothetical protein